jgi:hypothetical protein
MFALYALKLEEDCRNTKCSKIVSKKDKKQITKEPEIIPTNDLVACK